MTATTVVLAGVLTASTLILGGILAAAHSTTRPVITITAARTSTLLAAVWTFVAFIYVMA